MRIVSIGFRHCLSLQPSPLDIQDKSMSQRNSEYARVAGDTYVTPQWVWDALFSVEPWAKTAWDCCPTDANFDFCNTKYNWGTGIATNPPYGRLAEPIIRHAIKLSRQVTGKVAMLLPHAFDTAKTRRDLFEQPPFKTKFAITKRIRWENLEQKKAGPSQNHAWFVWDWSFVGKPTLGWLP